MPRSQSGRGKGSIDPAGNNTKRPGLVLERRMAKKEHEADKNIRNGELEGPFNSAEEAIQALNEKE